MYKTTLFEFGRGSAEQSGRDNQINNEFTLLSQTPGSFGNVSVVLEDFPQSASKNYSRTGAFLSVAHMTPAALRRCS